MSSDVESGDDGVYRLVPVEAGTTAWHMYHEIARTSLFRNEKREYYRALKDFADLYAKRADFLLSFNKKALGTIALEDLGNGSAALRMVTIHERYQRQGHGHALGALVEEFAKTQGVTRLCVNADPAVAGYYASLGFIPEMWSLDEYESFRESRVMPIQMVKKL